MVYGVRVGRYVCVCVCVCVCDDEGVRVGELCTKTLERSIVESLARIHICFWLALGLGFSVGFGLGFSVSWR